MKVICFLEGFDKVRPGYPEDAIAWLKDYDYFAKRICAKYYVLDMDVKDEILYKALCQLTDQEINKFYLHEKGLTATQVMLELQTKNYSRVA